MEIEMTEELFGSSQRWGKVALQKQQWATLKCMDCGGELEIEKDNEFESVNVCQDCGSRALLIKKIRKEKRSS